MTVVSEIYVDLKITKLQMLMLKVINYPRVLFGLPVICPRWCVGVSKPYVKLSK